MKEILFINSCPRGEKSRSLRLARAYLDTLARDEYIINEIDITDGKTQFLTADSFDEKGETRRDIDVTPALMFAKADRIIIAAPYWEFLFPAVLSAYMERVSVPGITFKYTDNGSVGLCKAKTLIYIYTAGDILDEGDKLCEKYFEKLSKLYGIEAFESICAEGLDINPEEADKIVEKLCENIKENRK